jgi:hypothetical protein
LHDLYSLDFKLFKIKETGYFLNMRIAQIERYLYESEEEYLQTPIATYGGKALTITGELVGATTSGANVKEYNIIQDQPYIADGYEPANATNGMVAYYTNTGAFISSEYATHPSVGTARVRVILHIPVNAARVRIFGNNTQPNALYIANASFNFWTKEEVTPTDVKNIHLIPIIDDAVFSNKVTLGGLYTRKYANAETGVMVSASSTDGYTNEYVISDSSLQYCASGYVGSTETVALAVYYTSNGTFLSSEYLSDGTSRLYTDVPLHLPTGAGLVRIFGRSTIIDASLRIERDGTVKFYVKEESDEILKESVDPLNKAVFSSKGTSQTPINEHTVQYVNKETGELTASTSQDFVTKEYAIVLGKEYYASGYVGSALATCLVSYYDNDYNYLGYEYGSSGVSIQHTNTLLSPPNGATICRVSGRTTIISANLNEGIDLLNFYTQGEVDEVLFDVSGVTQIKNTQIIRRPLDYQVKICCFGSSWFQDTWWYLNKMLQSAGIDAILNCFYVGSAQFSTWNAAFDNNQSIACWSSTNGANWTTSNKTFKDTLTGTDWDIICFQQGARNSTTWDAYENQWSGLVSKIKKSCAADTAILFNNTFTPAVQNTSDMPPYPSTVDGQKQWQEANNKYCKRFLNLSGIDIVAPNGSTMWAMRRNLGLNAGIYDMADDGLHPNNGLPMYGLCATLFQTIIAPMYGIGIDNVDWMPDSSTQKAPVSKSTYDPINEMQRDIIRNIVKLAASDRWGFSEI